MYRTCLVTGSASGIGKVTAQLLRERGNTVIGLDLRDSDITFDLTTADGRAELVRASHVATPPFGPGEARRAS